MGGVATHSDGLPCLKTVEKGAPSESTRVLVPLLHFMKNIIKLNKIYKTIFWNTVHLVLKL